VQPSIAQRRDWSIMIRHLCQRLQVLMLGPTGSTYSPDVCAIPEGLLLPLHIEFHQTTSRISLLQKPKTLANDEGVKKKAVGSCVTLASPGDRDGIPHERDIRAIPSQRGCQEVIRLLTWVGCGRIPSFILWETLVEPPNFSFEGERVEILYARNNS
jgi:hypothetical protein